jgi:prepilin-type N-terminal cleavage/methylation domain-containing protein/prepilin-type processing-associated H-X9-DG protein
MVRKAGFTLIELLVAVAIIALLIAILLPALSRAREQAKTTVCAANLKGIGSSFHTYAAEYNGIMPQASMRYPDGSSNGAVRYWFMFYNGTLGTTYFAFDPSKPNKRSVDRCPNSTISYWNGAPVSYGMFVWHSSEESQVRELHGTMTLDLGVSSGGTQLTFEGFQTMRVKRPAETLILTDSSGGDGTAGWPPIDMSYGMVYVNRTSASTQSRASAIWTPHMERSNVLYFDGHAATAKVSDLKAVANYNKFTTRLTGVSVYKNQKGVVITDLTPP